MKFKALRAAMTAALVTIGSVAVVVAMVEQSLTERAEPGVGPVAQVQEGAARA